MNEISEQILDEEQIIGDQKVIDSLESIQSNSNFLYDDLSTLETYIAEGLDRFLERHSKFLSSLPIDIVFRVFSNNQRILKNENEGVKFIKKMYEGTNQKGYLPILLTFHLEYPYLDTSDDIFSYDQYICKYNSGYSPYLNKQFIDIYKKIEAQDIIAEAQNVKIETQKAKIEELERDLHATRAEMEVMNQEKNRMINKMGELMRRDEFTTEIPRLKAEVKETGNFPVVNYLRTHGHPAIKYGDCCFKRTGRKFIKLGPFYRCRTCFYYYFSKRCLCRECAITCHRGHYLVYDKGIENAYCDCCANEVNLECQILGKEMTKCVNQIETNDPHKKDKLTYYCRICAIYCCIACSLICHKNHDIEIRVLNERTFTICNCAKSTCLMYKE